MSLSSACGVVNSKDRLQAETFILAEEEVLIVILLHSIENKAFHSRDFILRLLNSMKQIVLVDSPTWDHNLAPVLAADKTISWLGVQFSHTESVLSLV